MTKLELINDINNNLLNYEINYNQSKADILNNDLKEINNRIKNIAIKRKNRKKIPMLKYFTWQNHYILVVVKTLILMFSLLLRILNIHAIITLLSIIIITSIIENSILNIIDDEKFKLEELIEDYKITKEEYDNVAMKIYQLTKKQKQYIETKKHKTSQHISIPTNQRAKKLQLSNKKVYH